MNKLFLIITCLCCSLLVMGQGQIKRHQKEVKNKVEISKPDGYINGHGYVDLGLPSGTKWSTCNVGANEPWKNGNFYAWGDVSPKKEYNKATNIATGKDNSELISFGIIGKSDNLSLNYDVAHSSWGRGWRLPTYEECKELVEKCIWTLITFNGRHGYKVVGPNGNSIFLVLTGFSEGNHYAIGENEFSNYWSSHAQDRIHFENSSDAGPGMASVIYLGNYERPHMSTNDRYFGNPVRPVHR